MKNKLIIFLCAIILLTGCGGGSSSDKKKSIVTEPIVAGDYKILRGYTSSTTRQTHIEFNRGWYDREAVGKGLMSYSKKHFSPDSYYMMEGQVLERGDLQTNIPDTNDKEGLLGRKSSENEYGLNPEAGSNFLINGGEEIKVGAKTTPIVDIFEINFTKEATKKPDVDGISLAIVLTPNIVDEASNAVTVSDDVLFTAGEQAAITLVDFLRKKPEIGNKVPIYITLFKATSTDDSLPGTFFGEAYGKDSISMTKLKEEWVVFSSETAAALDPVTAQEFDALKSELYLIVPNDTGIIAKGKYMDDKLSALQITVTMQAKTYTESSAIIQTVNELLSTISNTDAAISVRFVNDEEAIAMIKRDSGSTDTTVIIY